MCSEVHFEVMVSHHTEESPLFITVLMGVLHLMQSGWFRPSSEIEVGPALARCQLCGPLKVWLNGLQPVQLYRTAFRACNCK
jgi:hypothetical protein